MPRIIDAQALRLLNVSFDSTLRANLSVGMPIDVHVYGADSLVEGPRFRIEEDNPAFNAISDGWSLALKSALDDLPEFEIP